MLQLAGDIPADLAQPIAGLDAGSILARESKRLADQGQERGSTGREERPEDGSLRHKAAHSGTIN